MRYVMQLFLLQWFILIQGTDLCAAERQRNVLLLISDNHNATDLGCYGNSVVKTPHIDRLSREGVRFRYAFATTASCSASRAVMYTGLHAHSNGQYGHAHGFHNYHLLPHVKTIFALLGKAGYRTGVIGKYHISPQSKDPLVVAPHPEVFIPGSARTLRLGK